MTAHVVLALLLLAACTIHGAEQNHRGCNRLITDSHLRSLSDLIDSQMKPSCLRSFQYVDERELNNTECFLRAAHSPLKNILDGIEFKSNTPNHKKLEEVKVLHLKVGSCMDEDGHDEDESKHCIKRFYLTAEEMLQLVYSYFSKAKQFFYKANFSHDCSSVFQKCSDSQGKGTTSPDQLDSKEAAASTLHLSKLPGTTQTQGGSEGRTRTRMHRSTQKGQGAAESMDFRVNTDAIMSSPPEEIALAAVSQGLDPLSMDTASLLDPSLILHLWSPRLRNIHSHPSRPSQQHTESMGMGSLLPSSGAGSSQTWASKLSSFPPPFSGSAKPSLSNQWLKTTEVDEAIPGLASDWDMTDTSSASSLTLASFASLHSVDSSGVPSGGRWATLLPSDPALSPEPGSENPVSATQQLSRLVVTTDSPSSARQVSPESYSWGEQGSRGRAPGVQHSTQLRERRAEQEEGLAKNREPEDSMSGPSFDPNLIPPNTDKHIKEPGARDTQGMAVPYVVVPSVLGILLAVGGLLFYMHKSRILARRRLQRNERNMERSEGRPLNRGEEHMELQIQEEL
ncbi:macrophage colony-stimulating factor 1 isoform X2 [Rhineura floridana]|uniref:macrophage colony-stimulating factor 1 isoform X2 n=1 Tax=Rhineura floridana TaxID=261503 RepID=UPI002AC7ED36|nr:macrophage colony-stimulating factor 1 isoform X2 [Rhineura floridana]